MYRIVRARFAGLAALCLATAAIMPAAPAPPPRPQLAQRPVDLLLRNAAVYTLDESAPWAEALAITAGRITWVGPDAGAAAWVSPTTEVLDLAGRMVLPGFHDSHVHPVSGGIELGECDLNAAVDVDEVVAKVRECAAALAEPSAPPVAGVAGAAAGVAAGAGTAGAEGAGAPRRAPGQPDATVWLRGGGWQLPIFPNANPHKDTLDAIVPDHPAYLSAADGHSAWVNARALEIAGITADTPDPPGGRIERDPATGEPTGTLREAATRLVRRHMPDYTIDDHIAGLRRGQEMANRFGITSLIEANADPLTLGAYAELDRRGELTVRARLSLSVDPSEGIEQIATLNQVRAAYRSPRVRPEAVKIFADGVIEAHTAALLQPYTGLDHRGELNVEPRALDDLVAALDRAGFQIHVHAIGDRAIRVTLDALEAARRFNGPRDARPLLAHIQLFHPQDIGRFAEIGAIAGVQPLWAYADAYITELTEPVLGPERSRWLYPMGSLAASGAVLACGSDWSVSSMNPLEGIQVAMTRVEPGTDGDAWLPEERLDLATAIACYTRNGAYAAFEEEINGTIEVGKAADLVVLDRNLFEVPAGEIESARVVLTLLEGEVVWREEVQIP